MKLSFCSGAYEKVSLSVGEIIRRVSDAGYDGIELAVTTGMPKHHASPRDLKTKDRKALRDVLNSYDLEVPAMHRVYTDQLSIIDPDASRRRLAVKHTKEVVELASDIGAGVIVIGRRDQPREIPYQRSWKWALSSLTEAGKSAQNSGVILAIEPINRYLSPFVNTVEEALRLRGEISLDSVQVMCDTHHMNIEEKDSVVPIRKCADHLVHVHASDSNLEAPGRGRIDFRPVIETLGQIGYEDYVSFEVMPIPDADTAARQSIEYFSKFSVF